MVSRGENKLDRTGKSVVISLLGVLVLMAVIAFARGPFSSKRKRNHRDETRERVEFVIDGDTVKLTGGERVRLLGIDAPEMRKGKLGRTGPFPEPGAAEATAALKQMIEGKVVRVARRGRDKYNRTLARLYLENGKDVGGELLKRKLAVPYRGR